METWQNKWKKFNDLMKEIEEHDEKHDDAHQCQLVRREISWGIEHLQAANTAMGHRKKPAMSAQDWHDWCIEIENIQERLTKIKEGLKEEE